MLASLEGTEVISFTGGVGENDAQLRAEVCAGYKFLGLELDEQKNASSPVDAEISTPASKIRVFIIHTEEDWEIAKECKQLMQQR